MVPSKMVPSEGNPKNRQEEDQWDLDDGERQHRAQHEHHKQQCAQGCCLPSWMTTDTLGLGDGAPRIRQIREQRYEDGGGLCQVNLADSLAELVGVEAPGGEMVAERRRGSLSRAGQTVGGIATGALHEPTSACGMRHERCSATPIVQPISPYAISDVGDSGQLCGALAKDVAHGRQCLLDDRRLVGAVRHSSAGGCHARWLAPSGR